MRILVVDDEGSLLMTIAANLELEGFDVRCADGGASAIELVARESFDLVLSDVRMPGMNGVDLFRHIRATCPGLPVLLMTAFAVETLIEEAISEGVFAVLPKPFEVEHLIAAVLRAGARPTVLLVDDENEAQATAEAVSTMGVPCRASTSPNDALEAVKERRADVCVVNLGNTTADGVDLVKRLLEIDASVAVIAVAASTVAALLRKAAALGAFACMDKPLAPARLIHLVAHARGRWRPGQQRTTTPPEGP